MKSRLILFASWINSDPRRAKFVLVAATLALGVVSVVHAGPMPGGTDVLK